MISVRNAFEAVVAIHNGADLVDVKEPLHGPLGMPSPGTVRSVARELPPHVPMGCALGEWVEWRARDAVPRLPEGVTHLKIGLSQLASQFDWIGALRRWRVRCTEASSLSTRPIWAAVAYADAAAAGAPPPGAVLDTASGCGVFLVDTFVKDGRDDALFDAIGEHELEALVGQAHTLGLEVALAGSLTPEGARRALELGADIVGVRGAACVGGRRDGDLDPVAISRLVEALCAQSVAT